MGLSVCQSGVGERDKPAKLAGFYFCSSVKALRFYFLLVVATQARWELAFAHP